MTVTPLLRLKNNCKDVADIRDGENLCNGFVKVWDGEDLCNAFVRNWVGNVFVETWHGDNDCNTFLRPGRVSMTATPLLRLGMVKISVTSFSNLGRRGSL